jgi:peptidoglycan-N-acetylglucosamine deacetylase
MTPSISRRARARAVVPALLTGLAVLVGTAPGQAATTAHSNSYNQWRGDGDGSGKKTASRHPTAAVLRTEARLSAAKPCGSGLVALTFDDGPQRSTTPRLLSYLAGHHLPATFFVVGDRIPADPSAIRTQSRLGFQIGNHTLHHEQLSSEGDAGILRSLDATRRRIVAAGGSPSHLMRPPYGDIDARVRSVLANRGLVPVLWTIDSEDWRGGSPARIASAVLGALRPGDNIVLQHDGVGNSANSIAALPRIVAGAHARGYCFARLDGHGHPVRPANPGVRIHGNHVTERNPGTLGFDTFTVALSRPTTWTVRILAQTHDGTAVAGADYKSTSGTITFAPGQTSRTFRVRVYNDLLHETTEFFRLHIYRAQHATIIKTHGVALIADDD